MVRKSLFIQQSYVYFYRNSRCSIRASIVAVLFINQTTRVRTVRSLECYTCDDSAVDGQLCTRDQLSNSSASTANNLLTCPPANSVEPDRCYTLRRPDGTTRRGCWHDETDAVQQSCTDALGTACIVCTEDKCNARSADPDVCIECDSSVHGAGCTEPAISSAGGLVKTCPLSADGQVGCYRSEAVEDGKFAVHLKLSASVLFI